MNSRASSRQQLTPGKAVGGVFISLAALALAVLFPKSPEEIARAEAETEKRRQEESQNSIALYNSRLIEASFPRGYGERYDDESQCHKGIQETAVRFRHFPDTFDVTCRNTVTGEAESQYRINRACSTNDLTGAFNCVLTNVDTLIAPKAEASRASLTSNNLTIKP